MLMRTDPLRGLDRLTQHVFGTNGTTTGPAPMPMDAYRHGEEFVVHFDIPGVDASTIELGVVRNVLTVRAERSLPRPEGTEYQVRERPRGIYTRQLFLGEVLDTERITADYDAGVLTLRIPIAEQAKPRRIEVATGAGGPKHIER